MSENQIPLPISQCNPEATAQLRLAVVAAQFNETLVAALMADALKAFSAVQIKREQIKILRVPGAHELPFAVSLLCRRDAFDAILALGVVSAGETEHHNVIVHSVSQALQRIAIDWCTPVINGVIGTATRSQAQARCSGKQARGIMLAHTTLAMASSKEH